ncbi:hypothetical protein SLA2020_369150 [Shorea laevis]
MRSDGVLGCNSHSEEDDDSSWSTEKSEVWKLNQEAADHRMVQWDGMMDEEIELTVEQVADGRGFKNSNEQKILKKSQKCQSMEASNLVSCLNENNVGGLKRLPMEAQELEDELETSKVGETKSEENKTSEKSVSGKKTKLCQQELDQVKGIGLEGEIDLGPEGGPEGETDLEGLKKKKDCWAIGKDKEKSNQIKIGADKERNMSWKCIEDIDGEESIGFWKGMASDEGSLAEGSGKEEKRKSKRRRRKAKSCVAVYRKSKPNAEEMTENRRGRQRRRKELVEAEPIFFPNPCKQVAGESLKDSGIINCNNCVKSRKEVDIAKEIWDFAKAIGVETQGDDNMVLEKIELMEKRDKEQQQKKMAEKIENGGRAINNTK